MGLLTKIIDREPHGNTTPLYWIEHSKPVEPVAVAQSAPEFTSCPQCRGSIFWLSVYNDGVQRCVTCEPPPSQRLVRTILVDGRPIEEHAAKNQVPRVDPFAIDFWGPEAASYFDVAEHPTGWPLLVVKSEFRKPLASRMRR